MTSLRSLATFLLIAAGLVLGAGRLPAQAQALVQNGTFTGSLAPWVDTSTGGASTTFNAGGSAQFISFFGNTARLSQTGVTGLDTTHVFSLAFDVIAFNSIVAGANTLTLTFNGVTILTTTVSGLASFSTPNFGITNGTGPLVFSFVSGGAQQFNLDNVVLTDLGVPELNPRSAAAPLALVAGALFLVVDRRRRVATSI